MRRAAGRKSVGSSFLILVCFFVYPRYCPSAGVVLSLERGVPCQRFGGGACHTGHTGNAPGRAFTGEMLFEDGAVVILFLVLWGMYREAFGGMCHLLVTDSGGSDGFQRINPTVAHTVGELFFLPPGNALREHVGKGFADYFLSISLPGHILTAGLMRMATSRNSLSRKGTRPSTPQAARLLLARRQSYRCSLESLRTVSS